MGYVNTKKRGYYINMKQCTIEIKGHIIDSLTLTKIMDTILSNGGGYVDKIDLGMKRPLYLMQN